MTSHISLDVDRDELIDEEFLFGGMKLTAKEQAEYRLVDTFICLFVYLYFWIRTLRWALFCKFGLVPS